MYLQFRKGMALAMPQAARIEGGLQPGAPGLDFETWDTLLSTSSQRHDFFGAHVVSAVPLITSTTL